MRDKSFYTRGLRFACQGSGNCCRNHGDYAWVYLQPEEVGPLARHLGLAPRDFLARHCRREDGWIVLRMDAPACPFLTDEHRCAVYPVRPKQCATWPFWSENLNPEAWARLSRICPGMDRGELHPAEEIERIADENDAHYE